MTAKSIHIGLNRVDPTAYNGWDGQLAGCVNDANSMRTLAAALSYSTLTLIDAQATSTRVLQELAGAASQLVAGDILLITYSGHGGQVDDVHGDEADGLDETWVLYDRELVDDELYAMWSQFAPGVRIVVLSDSCHSGTVAKATMAKEISEALARNARSKPPLAKAMPPEVVDAVKQQYRAMFETVQFLSGSSTRQTIEASVILISGCQDNQLSYDGDVNGQFTGTLLKTWQSGGFQGDYRRFHQAILQSMPPNQSPNYLTVGRPDPAFEAQKPFCVAAPGASTVPSSTSTRPTLQVGDQGPDVTYLQSRLVAHGYPTSVDGFFGRDTQTDVTQFQSARGLGADGVVGSATWAALEASPAASTQPGNPQPGNSQPTSTQASNNTVPAAGGERPTLRRGAEGEHVMYLQQRLRALGYELAADGVFGSLTESYVRSFQSSNGLTADGVVGPATWQALAPRATAESMSKTSRTRDRAVTNYV